MELQPGPTWAEAMQALHGKCAKQLGPLAQNFFALQV